MTPQKIRAIYSFSDPIDFLKHTIESAGAKRGRQAWSQKAWAKRLGYQSDRSLGMLLKRQRHLSPKMVTAIGKSLALGPTEFRYFDLLAKRDRFLKAAHDTSLIDREIQDILAKVPARQEPVLTLDDRAFSTIAKWYHFPIKELIGTPGFKSDIDWIRRRLRGKVSNDQVREAIANLLAIGVIQKDPTRGYVMVDEANIRKMDNIPSVAVRQHHAQMLQRAAESLSEQSLEVRELSSWTLRINPAKLGDAKDALRAFAKEFNDRFDDKASENVYQLNLQLFEHTRKI